MSIRIGWRAGILTLAASFLAGCFLFPSDTDTPRSIYSPDNGDGTYTNPIIYADYSDPDVCRAGNDYYMTASSFASFPGLPILHSKDLVNWTIIGHALPRYPDPYAASFDSPAHGKGVWAPAIRYHNGEFYIYFGDPDFGVFMTKTRNPAGPWNPLVLVKADKGWIDPCPFWDDDGQAYLVHGFARSRAGINNVLDICRMDANGERLVADGLHVDGIVTRVFEGEQPPASRPASTRPRGGGRNAAASGGNSGAPGAGEPHAPPPPKEVPTPTNGKYSTVEGPKLYKRNGYYYVFAPGGGVGPGYQIVFRSKNIFGPYESRAVMDRGSTKINGPHQGGWVDTADGKENWFIHFQEVLPYGRILHLEPMTWVDDWPIIGQPYMPGRGEPVATYKKPSVPAGVVVTRQMPQTSDEFNKPRLGLQWQWWGNFQPEWTSLTKRLGYLRMSAVSLVKDPVFYDRPDLLLQKFPAQIFTATTKVELDGLTNDDWAGLMLAGKRMTALSCQKTAKGTHLSRTDFDLTSKPPSFTDYETATAEVPGTTLYLRLKVAPRALCTLSYSTDGKTFTDIGKPVTAVNDQWIGAKMGVFCIGPSGRKPSGGYADFDWFRVE